jgi:hypothetical protein
LFSIILGNPPKINYGNKITILFKISTNTQ